MRVTADRDVCIGAGNCVLAAPAVFDQTDDGQVQVLVDEPGEAEAAAVHEAVAFCPAGALRVAD